VHHLPEAGETRAEEVNKCFGRSKGLFNVFYVSPQFFAPHRLGNSDFGLFACHNVRHQLGLLT
jgi:hypothetical protein